MPKCWAQRLRDQDGHLTGGGGCNWAQPCHRGKPEPREATWVSQNLTMSSPPSRVPHTRLLTQALSDPLKVMWKHSAHCLGNYTFFNSHLINPHNQAPSFPPPKFFYFFLNYLYNCLHFLLRFAHVTMTSPLLWQSQHEASFSPR